MPSKRHLWTLEANLFEGVAAIWFPARNHAEDTEDIFNGKDSKAARSIPKDLWSIAARKLSALDYAIAARDRPSDYL